MEKDKKILKHVEQYGVITINQAFKIFYNYSRYGYDMARKRLKYLCDGKYLKYYKNNTTDEKVYYIDKKISSHDLYVLDYMAELVFNNCKILEFDKPQFKIQDTKIIPDAFIKYVSGIRIFGVFVEIDLTHHNDLTRYEKLFTDGKVQEDYGAFPAIACITDEPDRYKSENFEIIYLDYQLNNFVDKVIII